MPQRFLLIITCCLLQLSLQLQVLGETKYFLVTELANAVVHRDSFVVGLTNPVLIAHARALITQGLAAGSPIVFADISVGGDGINRDLLKADAPAWSWHVTQVTGFGDLGIELLDGWPTFVEKDVQGWIKNTGGHIGFWNYTVTAELPFRPRIDGLAMNQDHILLSLDKLTPPFPVAIETTTNLTVLDWRLHSTSVPENLKTNLSMLLQPGSTFIRLRVAGQP